MALPVSDIYKEWQAPSWEATESRKLGWINEACQQGELWNKSQRGSNDWLNALDILSGNYSEREALQYRSQISSNRLKTNIEVEIEGLAAIRPWGGFQAQKGLEKYALMLNMAFRAMYLGYFWDQDVKSCLQWWAATNTGWMRPVYRRNMAGRGQGRIELDTFGTPSVLPVQLPANGDYQRAYVVNLLDEKPVWEAHGMFPDHQNRLKPTNSRYWYSAQIRKASQANNTRRPFWNPFRQRIGGEATEQLIPIRYSTINDLSINQTGKTIPMGQPGSSWYYEVPSVGQPLPNGRIADINDARMYPYRRLMISSQDCMLYDGPAFNWHGELDLIQFCLDRWAWEPIGFNAVHNGYKIQKGIDTIDRGTMDKIVADLDRPLAYDMNAVSKREATQVDLMQPRQRIAFDGSAVDKPFSQIAPDDVYKISAESMAFRDKLVADMDYQMQSRDIVELSKARALGKGMDQLEALISANGPLVKGKSRSMEKSVVQAMNQIKYLMLQYMDTSRLIPYITESGASEVFDYNPNSIIPSHLPGEEVDRPSAHPMEPRTPVASPTPMWQRARWFADNLPVTLLPHSLHEIHQMTYRLALMQMRQRGYPIAAADVMESFDVPDVKRPSGSTAQERFREEKKEEVEFAAEMAQVVQGSGVDIGALLGSSGPGKKTEGRPPSGQAPPQMKQKGDGRPVITESQ